MLLVFDLLKCSVVSTCIGEVISGKSLSLLLQAICNFKGFCTLTVQSGAGVAHVWCPSQSVTHAQLPVLF